MANKNIIELMLSQPEPKLGLALLVDLHYRFKEYSYLSSLLEKIMSNPLSYVDQNNREVSLDEYKFKLLLYYLKDVDMNLDVAMSTSAIERYIRVINLLNSQALENYPILFYTALETIYGHVKTAQFEKTFKKRPRKGSFTKRNQHKDLVESERPRVLSDTIVDISKSATIDRNSSAFIQSTHIILEEKSHEESTEYDVLLSILLGKLLVKFKDLKHRLTNYSERDDYSET